MLHFISATSWDWPNWMPVLATVVCTLLVTYVFFHGDKRYVKIDVFEKAIGEVKTDVKTLIADNKSNNETLRQRMHDNNNALQAEFLKLTEITSEIKGKLEILLRLKE